MSEPLSIARPYAKAAFAVATQHNTVDGWSRSLAKLAGWLGSDLARRAVNNPLLPAAHVAEIIIGKIAALDEHAQNFVRLLARNRRLLLLPQIRDLFEDYRAQSEQRVDAEVISALPLGKNQQKALKRALSQHLNAKVVLKCRVDRSLLAGARIHAGSLSIDGSLKARLQQLADTLNA